MCRGSSLSPSHGQPWGSKPSLPTKTWRRLIIDWFCVQAKKTNQNPPAISSLYPLLGKFTGDKIKLSRRSPLLFGADFHGGFYVSGWLVVKLSAAYQTGSYQPKQCILIRLVREIRQNYHRILLFDSSKWVICWPHNQIKPMRPMRLKDDDQSSIRLEQWASRTAISWGCCVIQWKQWKCSMGNLSFKKKCPRKSASREHRSNTIVTNLIHCNIQMVTYSNIQILNSFKTSN